MRLAGLGWYPWPAGGDGEKVTISTGSRILTLLDDARVLLDLEGALGVGGEDCEAMVVISERRMKLGMRSGAKL